MPPRYPTTLKDEIPGQGETYLNIAGHMAHAPIGGKIAVTKSLATVMMQHSTIAKEIVQHTSGAISEVKDQ